jgi:hypothetical protein
MDTFDRFKEIMEKQPIKLKRQLRIKNKDLQININKDVINLKNYFETRKSNINLAEDFIDFNIGRINNSYRQKKLSHSYFKIRKEIKQIYQRLYNDNSKNIINNDSIINKKINSSLKYFKNKNDNSKDFQETNTLNENYPIQGNSSPERTKKKNDFCQTIEKEKPRNKIINNISYQNNNKSKMKFEYGNYALNNTIFKHPQFYILNNNNYFPKEKLPIISATNTFQFKKYGDFSNLIPSQEKKKKLEDNFYSYYIGNKLAKNKFNL